MSKSNYDHIYDSHGEILDCNSASKIRIFSRLILFLILIIVCFNIVYFFGLVPSNLIGYFVKSTSQPIFYLFLVLSLLLTSSKDKDKYSLLTKVLCIFSFIFSFLTIIDFLGLINCMPVSYDIHLFDLYVMLINSILVLMILFRKWPSFVQVVSLINLTIGFFGFLYNLQGFACTLSSLSHYFFFHILFSLAIVLILPIKGIIVNFHLDNSASKLARYVLTFGLIFSFLFGTFVVYLDEINYLFIFSYLHSDIVILIGVLSFLLILVFIFTKIVNNDEISMKLSNKKAEDTEVFFEKMINYVVEGMIVTNSNDEIVYINEIMLNYLGKTKEECFYNSFYELKTVLKNYKYYFDSKNNLDALFVSDFVVTKPEETLYLSGWIVPLIHENKFDGNVITVTDMTDAKIEESGLKSAIDEKNMLLTEVHHRVKNNMQIVISMLNLQIHKINDDLVKYALKDSQNRVMAMSLVHENMYKNLDFSNIDLEEYVADLVDRLKSSSFSRNNIRFNLDIDDVKLNLDLAIPIGLIINELITNCIKYAFPYNDNGFDLDFNGNLENDNGFDLDFNGNLENIVDVIIKLNDGIFTLMIKDNGVGFSDNEKNDIGIGSEIVTVLVQQINGEYTCIEDNGVSIIIKFPNV